MHWTGEWGGKGEWGWEGECLLVIVGSTIAIKGINRFLVIELNYHLI